MSNKKAENEDDNVKILLPNEAWDAIKKAKAALAEIQRIFKKHENKTETMVKVKQSVDDS